MYILLYILLFLYMRYIYLTLHFALLNGRLTRYYSNRSARSPLSFHEQSNGLVCAWSSILLLKFLKKKNRPFPLGRSALARGIRACVAVTEKERPLCPPLLPHTYTHNLLYSWRAYMADGSSLLRLLPVVAFFERILTQDAMNTIMWQDIDIL